MAADGYPGTYAKGTAIRSLPAPDASMRVFQAGTSLIDGGLVATGGRVLNVTATGDTVKEAARRAYEAVEAVDWTEGFWRSDIGHRAIMTEA